MPINKYNELEFFWGGNHVKLFDNLCDITH